MLWLQIERGGRGGRREGEQEGKREGEMAKETERVHGKIWGDDALAFGGYVAARGQKFDRPQHC